MSATARRALALASALAATSGGCRQILGIEPLELGAGGATSASVTTASAGGASSASTSASTGGGSASSAGSGGGSPSSTSTAGSGGGATCAVGHLVISQVRTRGLGGPADEFVELFNPTSADVLLDATWTLMRRSATVSTVTYASSWTGSSQILVAHHHFLIAGSGYTQAPAPDDNLALGLTDAASVVLQHDAAPVDSVCFYYDTSALTILQTPGFTCEGMPVHNAHDETSATDTNTSLERLPGGAAGNCTDTDDNAADFVLRSPSTPESSMSPPTP